MQAAVEDDYGLDMNLEKACRICLKQPGDGVTMKKLFCREIIEGQLVLLPNVVQDLMQIKIEKGDPFPPQICGQCRNKIIEFQVLKQKCIASHKIFLEIQQLVYDYSLKPSIENPQPKKVNNETQTELHTSLKGNQTTEVTNKPNTSVSSEDRKPKVEDADMSTEEAFNCGMTYHSIQIKAIKYLNSVDNEGAHDGLTQFCSFYANFTEGNCLYCEDYFENVVRMQKHFTEFHDDVSSYYLNFLETVGNKLKQEQTNELIEDLRLQEEEEEMLEFSDHDNEETGMSHLPDASEEVASHDVQEAIQQSAEESAEVKWKRNIVTSSDQSVFGVEPDKHKCDLCLIVVQTEDKVKEHQRVHQEVNQVLFELVEHYICRSCNVVFLDLKDVQLHLPCTTSPHPNPAVEQFDSTFLIHLENSASRFLVFQAKYEDDVKINTDHSQVCIEIEDVRDYRPDVGEYTCGICLKHFGTAAEIKSHTYLHQPCYTCPVEDCGQVFDFTKKLILHIKYNHINRRRLAMENMECTRCETVFTDAKVFMQHIRLDCEMRKLQCNYCSRRFFNMAAKKNHEKTHAEIMAEEVIKCDICSESFEAASQLRAHVARNHVGIKPYKCEHCDKRFKTPSHRADHQETHNAERNYNCEVCNSKFKSNRVLKSHMKLHTEGKTHACPICGKLFSRSFHVKLHYKTHIKEENEASELMVVDDKN